MTSVCMARGQVQREPAKAALDLHDRLLEEIQPLMNIVLLASRK